MKKFTAMVALAATLAAPTFVIAAEYTGNEIVLTDHSMRSSKIVGATVYDENGKGIGKVMEVLVKNGAIEPTVVLSVGDYVGGGSKMVAVPLSHVSLEGAKPMMAGATKQMMASMPVYLFPPFMGKGG